MSGRGPNGPPPVASGMRAAPSPRKRRIGETAARRGLALDYLPARLGNRMGGPPRRRRRRLPACLHTEILPDEKKESATAFLKRALGFFARHGVKVERRPRHRQIDGRQRIVTQLWNGAAQYAQRRDLGD